MSSLVAALLAATAICGCRSFDEAPLPGGAYRLGLPADGPDLSEWLDADLVTPHGQQRALIYVSNDSLRSRILVLEADSMLTLLDTTHESDRIACAGPLAEYLHGKESLPFALLQIDRWPEGTVRRGLSPGLELAKDARGAVVTKNGTAMISIYTDGADCVIVDAPQQGIRARIVKGRK